MNAPLPSHSPAHELRVRRRFVVGAILFSLVLHGLLLYFFTDIRVGSFAIPAEKRHFTTPLRLKRVEIPAANLEQTAPSPAVPPPAAAATPPEPMPEAPPAATAAAWQIGPPDVDVPATVPGNPSGFTPALPAPPASVSPYSLDDRAKVEAAIAHLAGPSVAGAPVPQPASLPGAAPAEGTEGSGESGTSPSALPSMSQVATQFRLPPPGLNPNLPQPVVIVLPTDILFDFDSAKLHPGAEETLGKAADYIRRYARADIRVEGHTDTFGAPAYNGQLSLQRANAVAEWLRPRLNAANFGLSTQGYGSTRPVIDPHGTIIQQARNRRVEIVLRALPAQ